MAFLIPFVLFLLGSLILYIVYGVRSTRIRNLKKFEESWGKPKTAWFDFDMIARYAALTCKVGGFRLSEQTATDIDLDRVFEWADRTTSAIGQYLFKKIVTAGRGSDPEVFDKQPHSLLQLLTRR